MEGYPWGGEVEWGGKGTRKKKHNWQAENREVKNSDGKGEANELMFKTHGHELMWGKWVVQGRAGIKGRKNWDNCHSIINNIYIKIK